MSRQNRENVLCTWKITHPIRKTSSTRDPCCQAACFETHINTDWQSCHHFHASTTTYMPSSATHVFCYLVYSSRQTWNYRGGRALSHHLSCSHEVETRRTTNDYRGIFFPAVRRKPWRQANQGNHCMQHAVCMIPNEIYRRHNTLAALLLRHCGASEIPLFIPMTFCLGGLQRQSHL